MKAHSRDPAGRRPGSSCRSKRDMNRSRTAALISWSSRGGEPQHRLRHGRGRSPFVAVLRAARLTVVQPGDLAGQEDLREGLTDETLLQGPLPVVLAPCHPEMGDLPGALASGATLGLLDEPVLGKLAKMPGTVRRALVEPLPQPAGRHRPVDRQLRQDRQAQRTRHRPQGVGVADRALRQGLIVDRKYSFERLLAMGCRCGPLWAQHSRRDDPAASCTWWSPQCSGPVGSSTSGTA